SELLLSFWRLILPRLQAVLGCDPKRPVRIMGPQSGQSGRGLKSLGQSGWKYWRPAKTGGAQVAAGPDLEGTRAEAARCPGNDHRCPCQAHRCLCEPPDVQAKLTDR